MQKKKNLNPSNNQIFILGLLDLQNELLAYVLEKEMDSCCCVVEDINYLPDNAVIDPARRLLFIDCERRVVNRLFDDLRKNENIADNTFILALFNLQHGRGIEQKALQYGIKGFFYQHERLELILKGVKALFHDETWLARDILVECAVNTKRQKGTALK